MTSRPQAFSSIGADVNSNTNDELQKGNLDL